MSYQAELLKLADELQDVEMQVIQDIIDYRKAHGRTSQKKIGEQFGVELDHVKKISKFMKDHLNDMNCELGSQSSTMTGINDAEKDDFTSVAELNQYLVGFGDEGDAATKEPTLLERMLTDHTDDEENDGGSLTENKPEEISPGEKLIKHVKWFVDTAEKQVRSLENDAELFDTERNGFKLKNYQLKEASREKDLEIAKLKTELAQANTFHKEKMCIRCDQPKKYIVANIRFCSILCIKQAKKDLDGADELTFV